jgi:hypothetical protein
MADDKIRLAQSSDESVQCDKYHGNCTNDVPMARDIEIATLNIHGINYRYIRNNNSVEEFSHQ